jgi:hypothetical protein
MPVGGLARPGPGFFPLLAGIALGLLSLGLVVEAMLRRGDRGGLAGRGQALVKPFSVIAALVVYALLLEQAGYLLSTVALLAVLLAFERQRWPLVIAVSVGGTLVSYWLFALRLAVPLPRGLFPP